MDLFIQALSKLDLPMIIIVLGGYYLMNRSSTKHMDEKFDKFEAKIDKRCEMIEVKIDKIQETITDIDRRLCRLEGAFASKDCCMIKDSSQLKKAE